MCVFVQQQLVKAPWNGRHRLPGAAPWLVSGTEGSACCVALRKSLAVMPNSAHCLGARESDIVVRTCHLCACGRFSA